MISLTSPVRTRAHGWPVGAKLAGLCIASTGLFMVQGIWFHAAALAVVAALYALPGRAFLRAGLSALRVLVPFVVLVMAWHVLTGSTLTGIEVNLRMLTLVALANLVTMTTRLDDLVGMLHRLTAPLRRMGLSTQMLELGVPLVVRFTPVLIDKAGQLSQAWRARARSRPGWRILLPLSLQALDDADHVAEALRARSAPD